MGIITTNNPKGAGRNTTLTDDVLTKIKDCVIRGLKFREIAKELDIPETTIYTWSSDNYLDFATLVDNWKRDRKLILAVNNIEDILKMGVNDKETIKVVSDMSKFVAETLGKDNYSKRNELTGKDGKDLTMQTFLTQLDESETKTKGQEVEDK